LPLRLINDSIKSLLSRRNIGIVNFGAAEQRLGWMKSIARIRRERSLLLTDIEACQIISALNATRKIPGDIAELGVAYGASAKLICEYSVERQILLFDTFQGLPKPGKQDAGSRQALCGGEFTCSLEDVSSYVANGRCRYFKGLFPDTAAAVADRKFSFVHLDVDLYESTLAGLEFFYPRMSPGGIIVSHDYPTLRGVDRAVNEFFANKPEPIIEVAGGYQCLAVKR
jgi:O-methyltransferase